MTDSAVAAMLGARSVAVVGASARPGSLGARMVTELGRSPGVEELFLVNPHRREIDARATLPSLAAIGRPVDLVLLGVADPSLPGELAEAARLGARAAVIYGSAHGADLRDRLRRIAAAAGMALCGAGCMGFLNAETGLRALGYIEPHPLQPGSVALVSHSGSVFSALLRARRAPGFSLAVSSGQELVTTTAEYVEHALQHTSSRVLALVLETIRDGPRLRAALHLAADRDVPVVLLPVGGSPVGSAMVAAHSGALAGAGAGWEALCEDTGALRVGDLGELADTLELLALRRGFPGRRGKGPAGSGIATVHDSGAERALVADVADAVGVPFAPLAAPTRQRLAEILDDGLEVANPLDVWGSGADTRKLFAGCLRAMADDPSVALTLLAVDLVPEFDGDTSYPDAVLDVASAPGAPLAVLANLPSALDHEAAARLRAAGVPVLEGTRSGLVAARHLLHFDAPRPSRADPVVDAGRRARWLRRLADPAPWAAVESFRLLRDYGVPTVACRPVTDEDGAAWAAHDLGFPVVLKADDPAITHRSDVGGVLLGLPDEAAARRAYRDLAARLGPRVLVARQAGAGVELSVGIVRDPHLGPLVVLGAGGELVELVADRVVACPPLAPERAGRLLDGLRISTLLNGFRGRPPADVAAVVGCVVAVSQLALELGDGLAALDVNPLIAGPDRVVAVDALVVPVAKVAEREYADVRAVR